MERQTVLLEGGPLDGERRLVHPDSGRYFEEWDDGPAEHWLPPARKVNCATYRRVDATTFAYAATQTAMGSPNPDFYKEEPEMSETATPQPPAQPVPPVQEPEPAEEPDQDDDNDAESVTTTETTTETTEVEF
jgi:hypothetical protein